MLWAGWFLFLVGGFVSSGLPVSGFARLSQVQARRVLALFLAAAAFCVAITFSPLRSGYAKRARVQGPGDVALFNAKIARMRGGEGYYEAAGAELRARGYPTRSVFNWRTPLPIWLIARLPHPAMGKALLCGLGVVMIALALGVTARLAGTRSAFLCAALLFGAVMPCFLGDLHAMPVLWAGVLMGISVCLYGNDQWRAGCLAGLAALFMRELAAPYCLLAATLALTSRRRGELAVWAGGFACYALFFLWHAWQVAAVSGAHELAHDHGWVRLGGAGFVISTVQMNAYLLVSPQWLSALYLAAAMLGLAGWRSALGKRVGLTVCMYVMLFAIVGQPFNQYWGSLIAPLFCFGAAQAPLALRDLWRRARGVSLETIATLEATSA